LPKEPLPKASETPSAPSWIGQHGRRLWQAYAPKLAKLGLLSEIDTSAWEALCHAYDRMRQASSDIKRHGRVYVKDGIVRLRPEVRIEAEARKEFRQYCAEFGLTPASRSRVAESVDRGRQPDLPMNLPDAADPEKALPPGPWDDGFTDDQFFGPTRH
jgi:P27 family predicted phage terminase small subunit